MTPSQLERGSIPEKEIESCEPEAPLGPAGKAIAPLPRGEVAHCVFSLDGAMSRPPSARR